MTAELVLSLPLAAAAADRLANPSRFGLQITSEKYSQIRNSTLGSHKVHTESQKNMENCQAQPKPQLQLQLEG